MNDVLSKMFNGNEGVLSFFGKYHMNDVIEQIDAHFGHIQNFVNSFGNKKSCGCTCESFQDMINSSCNTCYAESTQQDVCNLRNMRDFFPADYTKEMQDKYNCIVRECNLRQINMNCFVIN